MVDPWPPHSANRNIAFNGEKMQTAVERYRTGQVIPPVNATTSSAAYQPGGRSRRQQSTANSQASAAPAGRQPTATARRSRSLRRIVGTRTSA